MSDKKTFILKGISHQDVIAKFSLKMNTMITPISQTHSKSSSFLCNQQQNPKQVTPISSVTQSNAPSQTPQYKPLNSDDIITKQIDNDSKSIVTMVSIDDYSELPSDSKLSCFWDRHPFKSKPIGCPIQYVNSQYNKKYYSEITRNYYTMLYNLPTHKKTEIKESELLEKDYYLCDGVFCSFNCVMAFIEDNYHDSYYSSSKILLTKMYTEMYGKIPLDGIKPSPSWRLLSSYGGPMDICMFRDDKHMITYDLYARLRNPPISKMVKYMYEQKDSVM